MRCVNGRHRTEVRVRYAETDKMGIAYNSHYLTWFEVGRTELLRECGLTYEAIERNGLLLPVMEAGIHYLKPALYDDVIIIWTRLGRKPGVRVFLEYEITREDEALATGFTMHAFTDTHLQPVKPPRMMLLSLESLWESHEAVHRS